MDQPKRQDRLSRISTLWTLLTQAQNGPESDQGPALAALLDRYQTAVYRYLLGAVGDPDAAEDLFQDFALRFVGGRFRNVAEERGRFRDYLKRALSNQISTYRKQKGNRAGSPQLENPEEVPAPALACDLDQEFLTGWRQALLERAWEALAECQRRGGSPYHDILRLRYENPDLTTPQLAAQLADRVGQQFTEANVRKLLQRARDLFGDLLLDEIARSLQTSSLQELEEELIDLGFQSYCKRALERRQRGESS